MAQHAQKQKQQLPADGSGEEAPRPNIRRNNRRSLYHPASAADGNGVPEVYWSEGATPSGNGTNAQSQAEAFTFLREPTPEPTDRREKRGVGVGGGYYEDEDGASDLRTERRVCGFRPVLFWGIVAVTLVVLVGVAVGVGVGVGMQKPSPTVSDVTSSTSPTSTPDPTSSSSSDFKGTSDPTTTTDPSSSSSSITSTTTSRDPAYPTQTSSGSLICPDANYTLYAVPGSPVRFLRHCDVDMGAGNSAADIRSLRTESMAECMRNCAGTFACAGAGWGPVGSGSGTDYWCWLKTSEAVDAGFANLKGWEFAVMQ